MIHIVMENQKALKNTFQATTHSKLKKIQGIFKDEHRNLKTFQGLSLKFKDFSRL